MSERIGKVRINYNFYNGSDLYSDGDIENELLEIVKNNNEGSFEKIIQKDNRWPILYHLSKQRSNIIEWYPMNKGSSLLEIGSGCGAITGTLCDKVGKVTAVELSKRRSLINAYRNSDKANLEIIVGDLNDIKFNETYDIITLIGVLEYAPLYTKSEKPFEQFLQKIKSLLKPNGQLIIAIENKYGLKYWAGAREDHTGKLFDSIEGYPTSKNVQTFSKTQITKLLCDVGFTKQTFYYPIPDYKLPLQIFSDQRLPKVGELRNLIHNYDQQRVELFDESKVYDQIILEGKFGFFSNSFLIISKS